MAVYKGTAAEGNRAANLARSREASSKEFENRKETIKAENQVGLRSMGDMFVNKDAQYEEQFKAATVGLVSAEDWSKKRKQVADAALKDKLKKELAHKKMKERKEAERRAALSSLSFDAEEAEAEAAAAIEAEGSTADGGGGDAGDAPKTKKARTDGSAPSTPTTKPNSVPPSPTSTTPTANAAAAAGGAKPAPVQIASNTAAAGDAKDVKSNGSGTPSKTPTKSNTATAAATTPTAASGAVTPTKKTGAAAAAVAASPTASPSAYDQIEEELSIKAGSGRGGVKKLSKNPFVDTHFLPDSDREHAEAVLRKKLETEWKEMQEKVKSELIEITYSYWDGSGHRRSIELPKGTRMDQFLEKCRRDLAEAFHELRGTSTENLMYIKEDLIIPHHYTFYDLIISKARGKSGPLFHFDVHDDVRLTMNAKVEKDESHAGKIVTRAYYERNMHIFPCNRWEVYDPSVKREKYTIK